MKKSLVYLSTFLFISLFSSLMSCTTEETDIRDSYLGVYRGTGTWTNNGDSYSEDVNVTVSKSSVVPDKIILLTTFFSTTQEIAEVTVKNGNFSGAFTTVISGVSNTVTITSGSISKSSISYSFTAPGKITETVTASKL